MYCGVCSVSGVDLLVRAVEMEHYTEMQCISWLRQICQGVAHMHKNNIIHLDIRVSTPTQRSLCHSSLSVCLSVCLGCIEPRSDGVHSAISNNKYMRTQKEELGHGHNAHPQSAA